MNYGKINFNDVANGPGIRVSLFVSGCRNRCKGCFQPQTWEFSYGEEFTRCKEDKIIEHLNDIYIQGLSVLGGDPFEPENAEVLAPFLKRVKEEVPDKNIWCYTGYIYEDLLEKAKSNESMKTMLENIDTLVDGPFIEDLKDITLEYRGSSNQRIIELNKK